MPCTSWRSASGCAAGNSLGSVGRTSISKVASSKWFRVFSVSLAASSLSAPRPLTRNARCPYRPYVWRRLKSIARSCSWSARTGGRSGRNTAWSSVRCGTPMEPDNLRRSWGAIRKAAGLGEMRFHDLRHTCVTLLLNLGVPPQVVRDIVGHSDIEVTMTIYAHASLDDKRCALSKLGEALT
ncbi:site-specific integrase [Nonomuraea angiospora]|uniref:site-specific integrase n=1 Tax=Nonomuraea angiospora TaxID=46172 RepID=UPI0038D433C2